jgi:hypothetical protein
MDSESLYNELERLAAQKVTMYLTEKALTAENKDVLKW